MSCRGRPLPRSPAVGLSESEWGAGPFSLPGLAAARALCVSAEQRGSLQSRGLAEQGRVCVCSQETAAA